MEVSAIKARLRGSTRTVLKSLSQAQILENSEKIATSLLALAIFQEAKALSCFLSMPSGEVQTHPILERVLRQTTGTSATGAGPGAAFLQEFLTNHKRVFIPNVTGPKSSQMAMVELQSLSVLESTDYFHSNKWGIKEPIHRQPDFTCEGVIDLVLVPGIAFDTECRRLGQGRGYYDSFLLRANESNAEKGLRRPCTVGLCFDEQMLPDGEHVPVQEHDMLLDYIVTPSRVFSRTATTAATGTSTATTATSTATTTATTTTTTPAAAT
jgi:5-formyltetrahydrofolate cyclo-ligase